MANRRHRLKKTILITAGIIITIMVLVILFISPISKYLIEKYDDKYTGRNITIDWAYVNPFTGYIYLSNVKIYEQKSDSLFLSAKSVSGDFAMMKLFSKTYELSELTLTQPKGTFIQNKRILNLDDLIERFSSHDSTKAAVHFNFLTTKIIDGEFYYREEQIPINYLIKNVNFESTGKRWDADTIASQFSFSQADGSGSIKGNFTINTTNKDYRFAAVAKKFDLKIIQQYLKDLSNFGNFKAVLDADITATGNFNEQEDINAQGAFAVSDFHFGKDSKEDYAAFDKLEVEIIALSPKKHQYLFDTVALTHPYFKYERYDYLDNFQRMFGKGGANVVNANADNAKFNLVIEIARYIKVLSKNFLQSDYKVSHLNVHNADLHFNDYAVNEKFEVHLSPLQITADSIDNEHKRVNISARSAVVPYGDVAIDLSINPKDSSDFDMHYHLHGVPAALFNPYTLTYTSFALDRGTFEVKGDWNVRNGKIKSENRLTLIDPRTTKRLRTKDTKWIPLPLIMTFIRERGNAVDYKIPITGDLKNPKFHLGNVFLDLLTNIFVKPPTIPYGQEIKTIEAEIEKSLSWTWSLGNSDILSSHERFIEHLAEFLKKHSDSRITVHPQVYSKKEKEYILYFEAKKKYCLQRDDKNDSSFSEDDADEVNKMFIKDASFVHFLHQQINDSTLFTIPDLSSRLISDETVDAKLNQLNQERQETFLSFFKERKVERQITFSKEAIVVPYNGFSFYKIEYPGQFPPELLTAYDQMKKFNDQAPRKKYKAERQQITKKL
jgi:hypothetical protein